MTRACGNASGAQNCPANYICLQGVNFSPNYGYTNFDTIFWSFFTVFRLVERDFWEETMHYLLATAGPFHILVFIVLIFYISFQLCSLLWTPIALAYNYLKNEQWENDLLKDLNEVSCCLKYLVVVYMHLFFIGYFLGVKCVIWQPQAASSYCTLLYLGFWT